MNMNILKIHNLSVIYRDHVEELLELIRYSKLYVVILLICECRFQKSP